MEGIPFSRHRGAARLVAGAALGGFMILASGCGTGAWPRLAKGFVDTNQDGRRERSEYLEPTTVFAANDSILFVNRIIRNRTGETLTLLVWGPDLDAPVVTERVQIREPQQITHHLYAARELTEVAGYGTYLVNWRIGEDPIDVYSFEIRAPQEWAPEFDTPIGEEIMGNS